MHHLLSLCKLKPPVCEAAFKFNDVSSGLNPDLFIDILDEQLGQKKNLFTLIFYLQHGVSTNKIMNSFENQLNYVCTVYHLNSILICVLHVFDLKDDSSKARKN